MFVEYFGLFDVSIEIKLILNCVDCFSVRGIAFDVVAACVSEVVVFDVGVVVLVFTCMLVVELDVGKDVLWYCGRVIEGIDFVAKTPVWFVECLCCSGVCLVSLLVDIIQYVMLELG